MTNLPKCHFLQHKSQKDGPGLRGERRITNRLIPNVLFKCQLIFMQNFQCLKEENLCKFAITEAKLFEKCCLTSFPVISQHFRGLLCWFPHY